MKLSGIAAVTGLFIGTLVSCAGFNQNAMLFEAPRQDALSAERAYWEDGPTQTGVDITINKRYVINIDLTCLAPIDSLASNQPADDTSNHTDGPLMICRYRF